MHGPTNVDSHVMFSSQHERSSFVWNAVIHVSVVKCWHTVSIDTLWGNGYYKITS